MPSLRDAALRTEPVRRDTRQGVPEIITGQVDMLPTDQCEVAQQRTKNDLSLPPG
jgi:hypothetical protein